METFQVSHSSMALFRQTCEKKFWFRKILKHPGGERTVHTETGKALHAGQQSYWVYKDRDLAQYRMIEKYPHDINSNPFNPKSLEACYATLNEMISAYSLIDFSISQIKCLDGKVRQAIEVPFEIVLKDMFLDDVGKTLPISYVGYIDAILFDELNGEYIVTDIKTHRDNMIDLTAKYAYDEQCLPYALILGQILGQSITNLKVKFMSVYVDIEKPRVQVYTFDKDEIEIRNWARTLYFDIREMQKMYELNWWPRRSGSCMNFRSVCPYFDLCGKRNEKAIREEVAFDRAANKVKERVSFGGDPWIKMELELAA